MISFEKRRPFNGRINMAPLIDVVFLLLVFFMLSGTLRSIEAVDVTVPESIAGRIDDKRPITVYVGADGQLAVNQRLVAPGALTQAVAALLPPEGPTPRVVVKADATASSGDMMAAMREVSAAGIARIGIATRAPARQ
ncbi:MAG: biopolymer transporter ExbD [Rhodospirillaceae bacterium]|nr:biopolymer transporter ExbD [Rhodospirillaceae bacterium]